MSDGASEPSRRGLHETLTRAARTYPFVLVEGIRGVGKTTLARQLLGPDGYSDYVSLAVEGEADRARANPAAYVAALGRPTILDDVHLVPDLIGELQRAVERGRAAPSFLAVGKPLAGRAGAELVRPGRVARLRLGSLAQSELRGTIGRFVTAVFAGDPATWSFEQFGLADYLAVALAGGMPAVSREQSDDAAASAFYDELTAELLGGPSATDSPLWAVYRHAATRPGGRVKVERSADELGLEPGRFSELVTELVRRGMLLRLHPWVRTRRSAVGDSLRLFAADPGLCARALGVGSIAQAGTTALGTTALGTIGQGTTGQGTIGQGATGQGATGQGAVAASTAYLRATAARPGGTGASEATVLLEALVAHELTTQNAWLRHPVDITFWRSRSAHLNVDFLLETESGAVIPIAVTAGITPTSADLAGIDAFRRRHPRAYRRGILLYSGDRVRALGDDRWAVPLSTMWALAEDEAPLDVGSLDAELDAAAVTLRGLVERAAPSDEEALRRRAVLERAMRAALQPRLDRIGDALASLGLQVDTLEVGEPASPTSELPAWLAQLSSHLQTDGEPSTMGTFIGGLSISIGPPGDTDGWAAVVVAVLRVDGTVAWHACHALQGGPGVGASSVAHLIAPVGPLVTRYDGSIDGPVDQLSAALASTLPDALAHLADAA